MFDSSDFIGQSYFNNDGAQLYLVLQLLYYTLKRLVDTEKAVWWKHKDLSTEKLTTPTTTDNSLSPLTKWIENSNFCLMFKGSFFKQKDATFTRPNIIFFYCLRIRCKVT